jgi:hypothetical protein
MLMTEDADAEIAVGLRHYMKGAAFSYRELRHNLREKLGFRNDMDALVTSLRATYDIDAAANVAMERLGRRLDGAPPLDDIRDGRWREAP